MAIYVLFGRLWTNIIFWGAKIGLFWAKKGLFWAKYAQKQCFMVKEYTVTCAITIAYYSEINLQICNYAQK